MIHIVATHIGNNQDISKRALDLISTADYLLCESFVNGAYWKKRCQSNAELIEISEHTNKKALEDMLALALSSKQVVLISDAGTPVFADPGRELIAQIFKTATLQKIKPPVSCAPGASSLMAAISLCPFNMQQFMYVGFLNRQSKIRQQQILKYVRYQLPLIIFDTPYRISMLTNDLYQCLPKKTMCFLCLELTTDQEEIWLLTIEQLMRQVSKQKIKKRFVLILDTSSRSRLSS